MSKCEVRIRKGGELQRLQTRSGMGLQGVGAKHQTAIEYDCRRADCGICIVTVEEGLQNLSEPTIAERDFLKAMRADANERLACQCRVFGDVQLFVEDEW